MDYERTSDQACFAGMINEKGAELYCETTNERPVYLTREEWLNASKTSS